MATNLLSALREHLVAQGVVRLPTTVSSLPPIWLAPKLGTYAPGEVPPEGSATQAGLTAVVGAFITGGFAPEPLAAYQRKPIVDLRLRTTNALVAEQLELAISAVLINRVGWTMGGMAIIQSEQWNALSLITSDAQGFDYRVSYWFEMLRA